MGVTSGAAVTVNFEVNTPGTLISPGYEEYAIDIPTFVLTIGAGSTGMSAAANVAMQNAFPVADGVRLFSAPLVGGGSLQLEFGAGPSLFTSTNPLTNVGSWSGGFYTSYGFEVHGPGVNLFIDLDTFAISIPETGTAVCSGDGSGAACPCANNSPSGSKTGCLSSLALGGKLRAQGAASVGGDTLVLHATQVPNGPGLFFQGTALGGGGLGSTFGDGFLCASGTIIRMGVVFAAGNASDYPGGSTPAPISVAGLVAPGNQRFYQVWYRDATAGFCTPSVFNLTNALDITWGT